MATDSDSFPRKVDLGKEEVDYSKISPSAAPSPDVKKEDDRPTHTVYPRLYLRDVPDLGIPKKDGKAMIEYHRCRFSTEDDGDGKSVVCIELEVCSISFPDKGAQGEAVDQLSREIEAAAEGEKGDEDEEEDNEE